MLLLRNTATAWIIIVWGQDIDFAIFLLPSCFLDRYAYSDDASDEFDRDDGTLTLIKPSTIPSKDVRSSPEPIPVHTSNGASNGDLEEDKTE